MGAGGTLPMPDLEFHPLPRQNFEISVTESYKYNHENTVYYFHESSKSNEIQSSQNGYLFPIQISSDSDNWI